MQFTVFISHSSKDILLVRFIASQLQLYGLAPIIAQHVRPKRFPQNLSDKIKTLINESDCVVAIITKNSVTSSWVQQEIGYALDKNLIPIVEDGIPSSQLAFLQGVEYIPLYWGDIGRSAGKLVSWMTPLKAEKEQNENLKVLGVVILGGLGLWWLSQQK